MRDEPGVREMKNDDVYAQEEYLFMEGSDCAISPCGGCSPEGTSDYAACDGCQLNPWAGTEGRDHVAIRDKGLDDIDYPHLSNCSRVDLKKEIGNMTTELMNGLAHEIWATSQLLPNEGIEDGVRRVFDILERFKKECEG